MPCYCVVKIRVSCPNAFMAFTASRTASSTDASHKHISSNDTDFFCKNMFSMAFFA